MSKEQNILVEIENKIVNLNEADKILKEKISNNMAKIDINRILRNSLLKRRTLLNNLLREKDGK